VELEEVHHSEEWEDILVWEEADKVLVLVLVANLASHLDSADCVLK
jgi:hypothetical protein